MTQEELFYEMIFKRRSFHLFRNYRTKEYYSDFYKITEDELNNIYGAFETFAPLIEDIRVEIRIMANEESENMSIDCLRITQSCSNACFFHHRIIYNLMKVVATKNLMFYQKIEITSKRSTREKLLTYLLL